MFKRLLNIIKLWPEVWSVPVTLVLWVVSPIVLHWIDPVAATFDSGVLQVFLLAAIGMVLFNGLAWAGIKFNFPSVFAFYEKTFADAINDLKLWQATCVLLCLYLGYLLAFVLLAASIM